MQIDIPRKQPNPERCPTCTHKIFDGSKGSVDLEVNGKTTITALDLNDKVIDTLTDLGMEPSQDAIQRVVGVTGVSSALVFTEANMAKRRYLYDH